MDDTNPVQLVLRHAFGARLSGLFPRGARVLDLGLGGLGHPLALAQAGVTVHVVGAAPASMALGQELAETLGVAERVSWNVVPVEMLEETGSGFDGAYSDAGRLSASSLPRVGRGLAAALRPGAPVLLGLAGRYSLPLLVRRALRAEAPAAAGVGGEEPLRPSEARRRLGPAFDWVPACGLGALLPSPEAASWVEAHPQAFGILAALDRSWRGLPILRALGQITLLLGRRR